MLKRQFAQHECPLAQALGEIGDGWTLQIIREAIYGTTQFEAFRANTGASRGLLADRLAHLTAAAILRKTKGDSDGRETFYQLTQKGRDLWPVMLSLMLWSDKHLQDKDIVSARSGKTGARVTDVVAIDKAGNIITPQDTVLRPGKDISPAFKARIKAASAP